MFSTILMIYILCMYMHLFNQRTIDVPPEAKRSNRLARDVQPLFPAEERDVYLINRNLAAFPTEVALPSDLEEIELAGFDDDEFPPLEDVDFDLEIWDPEILPEETMEITKIGEWKPGLNYPPSCFVQTKKITSECCRDSVKAMHFEFYDHNIRNDESVLTEFLYRTEGKVIVLMGDFTMKTLFMGLAEVLGLGMYH